MPFFYKQNETRQGVSNIECSNVERCDKCKGTISPAYWVPRMTISLRWKEMETVVWELIDSVYLLAGNSPALMMVKSGVPKDRSSSALGRINMLCMNKPTGRTKIGTKRMNK